MQFLSARARDRESRREQKEAELELEQRELDWQYVQKIKEANDMLLSLAPGKQYRAYKESPLSELRIHLYEGLDMVKDLSIDRFRREFKRLVVEVERRESRARMGLPPPSRTESAKARRNATREEMRSVLLDTMKLVSKLRDQLEELEDKGGNFSPYIDVSHQGPA